MGPRNDELDRCTDPSRWGRFDEWQNGNTAFCKIALDTCFPYYQFWWSFVRRWRVVSTDVVAQRRARFVLGRMTAGGEGKPSRCVNRRLRGRQVSSSESCLAKARSTPATMSKQRSTLLPKRQQCWTSFALKFRLLDKVERCFDIVAQNGNIVEATGNFIDNVASTLVLVWTGLKSYSNRPQDSLPPSPSFSVFWSPTTDESNLHTLSGNTMHPVQYMPFVGRRRVKGRLLYIVNVVLYITRFHFALIKTNMCPTSFGKRPHRRFVTTHGDECNRPLRALGKYIRPRQATANAFAAARGVRTAMRPFVKSLGHLLILLKRNVVFSICSVVLETVTSSTLHHKHSDMNSFSSPYGR